MKILFILILSLQIIAEAKTKKTSFSEKYQDTLEKDSTPQSAKQNISNLMKAKYADFKKSYDSLDLIRKEFVQYFGKKERTYIVGILRKLEKTSEVPRMKLIGDEVHFKTTKKVVRVKMVSFIAQRFSVNEGLEVSIKDFSSLQNFMEFMVPKLDIVLNSGNFHLNHLLPMAKAYAQGGNYTDETEILAITIALLVIKIIHGRSDTCLEALDVFIDEFLDIEENCKQEIRNFNPSNMSSIEKIIKELNYIKKIIGIDDQVKDVCKKVGEFFDNENSISCDYEKNFTKTSKMCKQLNSVSVCVDQLQTKIATGK